MTKLIVVFLNFAYAPKRKEERNYEKHVRKEAENKERQKKDE